MRCWLRLRDALYHLTIVVFVSICFRQPLAAFGFAARMLQVATATQYACCLTRFRFHPFRDDCRYFVVVMTGGILVKLEVNQGPQYDRPQTGLFPLQRLRIVMLPPSRQTFRRKKFVVKQRLTCSSAHASTKYHHRQRVKTSDYLKSLKGTNLPMLHGKAAQL